MWCAGTGVNEEMGVGCAADSLLMVVADIAQVNAPSGNDSVDKIRVTFRPGAESELYDAALYYESQRLGLGIAFLTAIETAMDEIRE